MNNYEGNGEQPPQLSDMRAWLVGYDIDQPGSDHNTQLINQFSFAIYPQLVATYGTEAALECGAQLGVHLTRKAILELYEGHGSAVSKIMGETAYQSVLAERALHGTMSPADKVAQDMSGNQRRCRLYSELLFFYLNGASLEGIYNLKPNEITSIHTRGGVLDDPDAGLHKTVRITTIREDAIYTASANFECADEETLLTIRMALGFGISDEHEQSIDQVALDLLRIQLSDSPSQRLNFGTTEMASQIYRNYVARLEPLASLSQEELLTLLSRELGE